MLELKHKHHFSLPHLPETRRPVQFDPVPVDNDELTAAIVNDAEARDNTWELSERPDMGELTQFWSEVEQDVANDPEWFKFNEDQTTN